MNRLLIFMIFMMIIFTAMVNAQTPSAENILKKVDDNRISEGKIIVSKMIIHGRRGERTVEAKSWQKNIDDSFTEYLAPAREKGTKMLKLDDQLWMYSPSTDRTIMIAGHMLRQSVMGSDLSYEDMMEDPLLQNLYTAVVTGEEEIEGRMCWVLDLRATREDIAYHSRKIWVDKERFLMLKENLYAKGGKLLKTIEIREVMQTEGRWVAKSAVFKDALKEGEGTEFVIDSIDFGADIPDYIFSKASLRK